MYRKPFAFAIISSSWVFSFVRAVVETSQGKVVLDLGRFFRDGTIGQPSDRSAQEALIDGRPSRWLHPYPH